MEAGGGAGSHHCSFTGLKEPLWPQQPGSPILQLPRKALSSLLLLHPLPSTALSYPQFLNCSFPLLITRLQNEPLFAAWPIWFSAHCLWVGWSAEEFHSVSMGHYQHPAEMAKGQERAFCSVGVFSETLPRLPGGTLLQEKHFSLESMSWVL